MNKQYSYAARYVLLLQLIGRAKAMKKSNEGKSPDNIDLGKGIKFCLNCEDMDDLATDDQLGDKEIVLKRFQNCQKTGRFNGDICSRMYVVNENDFSDEQFQEPDDQE